MEKEREARRKMIPNRFTVASLLGSSCLSFFLFFWNYYDYFLSFLLIAKEEPQNEEIKTHPDSHGIIRIIHRLATVTITSGPARHHNLKKAHAPSPSSGRDKLPIKLTLRYNNKNQTKQKMSSTKLQSNTTMFFYSLCQCWFEVDPTLLDMTGFFELTLRIIFMTRNRSDLKLAVSLPFSCMLI